MKSVWETVVEPGWEISMHMWPIPEPPEIDLAAALDGIEIVDEGLPPPPPPAPSASGGKHGDHAYAPGGVVMVLGLTQLQKNRKRVGRKNSQPDSLRFLARANQQRKVEKERRNKHHQQSLLTLYVRYNINISLRTERMTALAIMCPRRTVCQLPLNLLGFGRCISEGACESNSGILLVCRRFDELSGQRLFYSIPSQYASLGVSLLTSSELDLLQIYPCHYSTGWVTFYCYSLPSTVSENHLTTM